MAPFISSVIVSACGASEHLCGDLKCVGEEARCNGVENCADGSDEMQCDVISKMHISNKHFNIF